MQFCCYTTRASVLQVDDETFWIALDLKACNEAKEVWFRRLKRDMNFNEKWLKKVKKDKRNKVYYFYKVTNGFLSLFTWNLPTFTEKGSTTILHLVEKLFKRNENWFSFFVSFLSYFGLSLCVVSLLAHCNRYLLLLFLISNGNIWGKISSITFFEVAWVD